MDLNKICLSPNTVQWSSEKPDMEGYYWYREGDIHDVVRVYHGRGRAQLVATGAFYEQLPVDAMDGFWAGPIPIPVEQ
jgi:hypothetical protein